MATLIRIMRIAVLTFVVTALVFLLLSLLSGLLSLLYVDDFGIWIPRTIFLACLAAGIWLVASDHPIANIDSRHWRVWHCGAEFGIDRHTA